MSINNISFLISQGGGCIHLKELLFLIILIFMAYYDHKTMTIPNVIPILIILVSFLPNFYLFNSLIGLFLLPLPFIIPILISYNSIGGGDIKLVGALGFFLGLNDGLIAVILGLTILIIKMLIIEKQKNKKIALGPYLAIGAIITLFL